MASLKILYVEDSRVDVHLLDEACKREGLESDIVVFDDGEKAIEFFRQLKSSTAHFQPDVFIVDYFLPWRSGCEVIREIRARSMFNESPVILFTSRERDAEIDQCCELGAFYLKKPLEHSKYSEIVSVLIKIAKDKGLHLIEDSSLAVEI